MKTDHRSWWFSKLQVKLNRNAVAYELKMIFCTLYIEKKISPKSCFVSLHQFSSTATLEFWPIYYIYFNLFTLEKIPHIDFSRQYFCTENSYFICLLYVFLSSLLVMTFRIFADSLVRGKRILQSSVINVSYKDNFEFSCLGINLYLNSKRSCNIRGYFFLIRLLFSNEM